MFIILKIIFKISDFSVQTFYMFMYSEISTLTHFSCLSSLLAVVYQPFSIAFNSPSSNPHTISAINVPSSAIFLHSPLYSFFKLSSAHFISHLQCSFFRDTFADPDSQFSNLGQQPSEYLSSPPSGLPGPATERFIYKEDVECGMHLWLAKNFTRNT